MASDEDKGRSEKLVAEASQKFASGDFEGAISLLDKAIALNPQNYPAWNERGNVRHILNQYEEAIKDFDEAIRLEPGDDWIWVNRGSAKYKLERYEEAIKDCDESIRLEPENSEAWSVRGASKDALGQHIDALDDLNEAVRLFPKDEDALTNRGAAKHNLNRYEEALKDFDEAISIYPKSASAWSNRGVTKIELGRYAEAVQDLSESLRLNRKNDEAWSNRGVAKGHLGQHIDAIKNFDEAIRLNPKNSEALNSRGTAKAHLKQFDDAIKDVEQALRLQPEHQPYTNNLAAIRAEKNAQEAIKERLNSIDEDTERLKSEARRYEDEHKKQKRLIRDLMIGLFVFIASCLAGLIFSGVVDFESDDFNPFIFIPWFIMIALVISPLVWVIRLTIQRANKAELMAAEYAHLVYVENRILAYFATKSSEEIQIKADYIKAMMSKSPSDKLLAMNKGKSSTEANQTPHEVIIKEIHKNLSGGNK